MFVQALRFCFRKYCVWVSTMNEKSPWSVVGGQSSVVEPSSVVGLAALVALVLAFVPGAKPAGLPISRC